MLIAEAVILASADPSCSAAEQHVLRTIADWPTTLLNVDDYTRGGLLTLDQLAERVRYPRPTVFGAVARLEDNGYLPKGAIR